MSEQTFRFFILTGAPGCGKTTMIKKVCDGLRSRNVSVNGFITEEVRSGRERIGFDVVLLNGKRLPFARVDRGIYKSPKVGKYAVDVRSFESFVSSAISSENPNSILVLDEIGKMELLSNKFQEFVSQCFHRNTSVILASVPLNAGKCTSLIEMIKTHSDSYLITVMKDNRNELVDKIINLIIKAKEEVLNLKQI